MGIGDDSAFPEHLDTPEERRAAFKDDNESWFLKWRRGIKHWFAFGPRSPSGIAFSPFPPFILARKWRDYPIAIFAEKGKGYWRFEKFGSPDKWTDEDDPTEFLEKNPGYYISRNQYWCEWHKALQWPLFYSKHKYDNPEDVIPVGTRADRDGKIDMFYVGAKMDGDWIYWYVAFYPFGRNFK